MFVVVRSVATSPLGQVGTVAVFGRRECTIWASGLRDRLGRDRRCGSQTRPLAIGLGREVLRRIVPM